MSPILKILALIIFCMAHRIMPAQNMDKNTIDLKNSEAYQIMGENKEKAFNIAQSTFSESKRLRYVKGELWAKLISSYYFISSQKLDTAEILLNEVLQTKSELPFDEEFAIANWYKGKVQLKSRNIDSARYYCENALQILREGESAYIKGSILNEIGITYAMQSDYVNALNNFVASFQMKEAAGLNIKQYRSEIANIGKVYLNIGDYDKAQHYTLKSINIAHELNDTIGIYDAYNAMGGIYNYKSILDSAEYYYKNALEWAQLSRQNYNISISYLNRGNIYYQWEKHHQSITLLMKALEYTDTVKDQVPADAIYSELAKNYLKLENTDSAMFYAHKAMRIHLKYGYKKGIVNISEQLYLYYNKKSQSDSALKYLEMFNIYRDSIQGQEQNTKLNEITLKLETSKKEKEIALLEKEKEIGALNYINLLITTIAVLLLTSLIIISLLFLRKRQALKLKMVEIEAKNAQENLYLQALNLIRLNNSLSEVEQDIKKINPENANNSKSVHRILTKINLQKSLEKDWENFNQYFGQINESFFKSLGAINGELSTYEQRLCALIKLQLTNKEIATILNIESKSVRMSKYRLKKKLGLAEEEDLLLFLTKIK